MSVFLGIDPGFSGAFSLVEVLAGQPPKLVWTQDMPVVVSTVGKSHRKRMDWQGLENLIGSLKACHPDLLLVTLEDPGARPSQTGAMAFGIGMGAVRMMLHVARLRVEMIVPTVWKPKMRAPKDKKEAVSRADELFPESREQFRGPRGGKLDGRAESAMIALYGAKHLL